MEKQISVTTCDVCKRSKNETYFALQDYGWTKYKFNRDWRSGIHAGEHDKELLVCGKCDRKKSTAHYIFYILKKAIGK